MYRHILIPLENSPYDQIVIEHIRPLAKLVSARLTLIHVADGWAARHYEQLDLQESEELRKDKTYLEQVAQTLRAEGFEVQTRLASGEPAKILRVLDEQQYDLVAMTTHGHRFLSDLLYGSTANSVRHRTTVPVLLIKAPRPLGKE